MKSQIVTHSGLIVDLQNPDPETIIIQDIAYALSNINRYTGHSRPRISVAYHSILVCENLPQELKLEGLLHDAAEAYLGDVSSPLKSLLPEYQNLESRFQTVIAEKFKLVYPFPKEVIDMDRIMLSEEIKISMPSERFESGVVNDYKKPLNKLISKVTKSEVCISNDFMFFYRRYERD